jgi:hypothetical protein
MHKSMWNELKSVLEKTERTYKEMNSIENNQVKADAISLAQSYMKVIEAKTNHEIIMKSFK